MIAQDEGETRLPLEDIAWIVLDTMQATLTAALLAACAEAGIAIILTDDRHLPSGLVLPFHRHHRQAEIASVQAGCGEGLRKRLWQGLVRTKIRNQGANLLRHGREAEPMFAMAERVAAGDPDNMEARAARHYWSRLFPDFTREDDADLRNAMLNYGYAVMRAAVARGLVAAGLLPAFGLHHESALNPFNLADDMLEPFRPVVDRLVWTLTDNGRMQDGKLTLDHRRALAGVLLETVRMGRETVTGLVATEMAGVNLVRAIESGSPRLLTLPEFDVTGPDMPAP